MESEVLVFDVQVFCLISPTDRLRPVLCGHTSCLVPPPSPLMTNLSSVYQLSEACRVLEKPNMSDSQSSCGAMHAKVKRQCGKFLVVGSRETPVLKLIPN